MASGPFEQYLQGFTRKLYVLWGALLASVAMHVGVAFGLRHVLAPAAPDDLRAGLAGSGALGAVLAALAVATGLASLLAHQIAISEERLLAALPQGAPSTLRRGRGPQATAVDLSELEPAERRIAVVLERALWPRALLAWVLAEAVAVLGLLGALLQQRADSILPYAAGAAGLLVWSAPRPHACARRLAMLLELQQQAHTELDAEHRAGGGQAR
ncbi:MAG: hypothetical protein KatS3mg102_0594 [Planctomycetota bacterium]|nr:MAG: hypothetical protein KatS3mg102_0594 [Planctomycetota bacterium]